MTDKIRLALTLLLIILFFPKISSGETINIEVNTNSSDLEAKIDYQLEFYESNIDIGAGMIYSSEDYFFSNLNFALKDEVFIPGLTLGLGLKGLVGVAEINNKDFNLLAISFLAVGEYDFRNDFPGLPIVVSASISMAPRTLCFLESERYLEFTSAVYVYLLKNGAVVAGYRSISARFEKSSDEEKKSDDGLFFGFKLSF